MIREPGVREAAEGAGARVGELRRRGDSEVGVSCWGQGLRLDKLYKA